jgi:hypothetical protein
MRRGAAILTAGHLNAPFGARGKKFVTKLQRFLHVSGYAH